MIATRLQATVVGTGRFAQGCRGCQLPTRHLCKGPRNDDMHCQSRWTPEKHIAQSDSGAQAQKDFRGSASVLSRKLPSSLTERPGYTTP